MKNKKREILEIWIKEQRDKNKKEKRESIERCLKLSNSLRAKIVLMHRTTFTKKPKTRIYKFDWMKEEVTKEFNQNKGIYGSRRLVQVLSANGITINDRTLRNYMIRWGLITKTRVKRRKSESKNTNVKFADLVKRNFNPKEDNIVATDVSYIPAKVK